MLLNKKCVVTTTVRIVKMILNLDAGTVARVKIDFVFFVPKDGAFV